MEIFQSAGVHSGCFYSASFNIPSRGSKLVLLLSNPKPTSREDLSYKSHVYATLPTAPLTLPLCAFAVCNYFILLAALLISHKICHRNLYGLVLLVKCHIRTFGNISLILLFIGIWVKLSNWLPECITQTPTFLVDTLSIIVSNYGVIF